MGLTNATSFGVNPIPSYNVLVHQYANFQEQGKSFGSQRLTRGKRKMVIHSTCGGTKTGCTCNVWVYSLDGLTTLGPFTLIGDDRVYVDIDEREWGVVVESSDKVCIDVWIEESKASEGKIKKASFFNLESDKSPIDCKNYPSQLAFSLLLYTLWYI